MRLVKHFFIGFVVGYTAIITLQLLLQAIWEEEIQSQSNYIAQDTESV